MSGSATLEATRTFISNNGAPFQLWQNKKSEMKMKIKY